MSVPEAAGRYYAQQKAITAAIADRTRRLWGGIDPNSIDHSITQGRIGEQIYVTVSAGQMLSASLADPYLDAVLAEQNIDPSRTASVAPRAFAGRASDGRSMETLLYEPVIAAKVAISGGSTPPEALALGEVSLMRIVLTQVHDAGRTAVGTGMIARPAVTKYVRMLNPPSCARCTILAGRIYRHNAGFPRHIGCDCFASPATDTVGGSLRTDPKAYFDSLSAADQAKYFTQAGAQAINDGADIGQVVNAGRKASGLYQANGQTYTTEATTKRSLSGKRFPGQARPMPETVYENATDRAAALEELRRWGYIA